MKPGLADMKNAIVVPHIASASKVIRFTDKMVETYRYVPLYQPASFKVT